MICLAVSKVRGNKKQTNSESKTKSCQPGRKTSEKEEHLKNLLGNSSEITDKPSKEITNGQQDLDALPRKNLMQR